MLQVRFFIGIVEARFRVGARLAKEGNKLLQRLSVKELSTDLRLLRGSRFSVGDLQLFQVVFRVASDEVCDGAKYEDIKGAHEEGDEDKLFHFVTV